ncbi:sensor histidine kinase [Agromyces atrinae]|uniref:Sensor-like histidine kinase SenX3 n=1 Tax=Agromyces atrinae TaxID=592376 RepID=A0A4V1R1V5_9MICO|nr:GAF domain-containing sensor histidine kinase [Agromyces atrinae]NYD68476.1 signal transduction histidine kinase [Agromyces atrinae]RXZ84976.1 GAF domain-containing sensor histidine kinase [Agromyces atrinae]
MITAQDETRRLAIADYQVVGREPESDLQSLVQLAAMVCGVSTAVINIIDDRYQHQVAAVGLEPGVCSREDSMCAVVFQEPGSVVVADARVDPRFSANPFVTGEIGLVRFYASSPLITPEGIPIGTICVFDEEVGNLDHEQGRALDVLAHQIVDVLELRRMTRVLGESNEQLAQFAGQVSHDLRNPLMALSGFIELASDSPEMANAPEAAKSLLRAEAAADRMATMISDLLDYARSGGTRPRRADVDLAEIVGAAVEDLDATLAATGSTVVVDTPHDVAGDATLLRVLLQNLIANAVKFTAASGREPHIEVRSSLITGGWHITVDDNGPGIPVDQRDRVFGLMERGSAHSVAGLGIGLSTCKRIVEGHGGRIGIEDSPLGGTRFWVVLPAS